MEVNLWLMLALGVIAGGLVTWFVALVFYRRQSRDAQKMADSLAEAVETKLAQRNLVAPVIDALREAGAIKTPTATPVGPLREVIAAGGVPWSVPSPRHS